MKQRLELIVISEVDHDKQLNQEEYERALKEGAADLMKRVLGTPKKRTEVLVEYGDPV